MTLPRRVRVLDYSLRIKQVGKRDLAEMFEDDETESVGAWISGERTIYILRSLSRKEKRATLLHELQHALVDLKEWG
jgi:Zn-dependent peptidase ImmA (M78 family)